MVRPRKPTPDAFRAPPANPPAPKPPAFPCDICGAIGTHRCTGGKYTTLIYERSSEVTVMPGEEITPACQMHPLGSSIEECRQRSHERGRAISAYAAAMRRKRR